MKYPKILVLSNNCFSQCGSNGRTLGNFFEGWPQEHLAQFYLQNEVPDLPVCQQFYRITDREVLNSFLGKKQRGQVVPLQIAPYKTDIKTPVAERASVRKTPLHMLLRNFVWNRKGWRQDFLQWVESFDPEVILVQSGDAAFMLRLATELAQERKIPLIVFNTESYYFKDTNFMQPSKPKSLLYRLFLRQYRQQFKRTIAYASYSIYNSEMLQERYAQIFDGPFCVLYTSSTIEPFAPVTKSGTDRRISYLGNLGVGRHVPLVEIGNALQDISPHLFLDVYGAGNSTVLAAFAQCPGIHYHGVIPYAEVLSIMECSDLLIHAENSSDFYCDDLQYAFSTKIADCLASGIPFLMYAPETLAGTQYLLRNQAAYVVTEHALLEETLRSILCADTAMNPYAACAKALVAANHRTDTNHARFRQILCDAVQG